MAAYGSLALPIAPWLYGAAFIVLVLVFWNATSDRVPLSLTNRRTWAALADMLPETNDFAFVDLGCGIGGLLADLARRRPAARWIGVESAPIPFALAWLRLKLTGRPIVELRFADMWRQDLAEFDIVYCFLSPAPMPNLFDKEQREMKPGSRLISTSFVVPSHPADEVIEVDGRRQTRLHVWHMGGEGEKLRD